MNSTTASSSSMAASTDSSSKKVRKPYTITKSRESWTDEEHDKFLEALQLFDRDWKKIEDFVGSKTVIQIRSHAQKYFLKVQKNGAMAHVPPPRPKRKASHPYPQKAQKNGLFLLLPLQASSAYPSSLKSLVTGYSAWDDSSVLINSPSSSIIPSQDEYNFHGVEEIGSKEESTFLFSEVSGMGISSKSDLPISALSLKGDHYSPDGIPDFAEVYKFIGSVFDPETKDHVQKLKELDPINFETVLLLMRNLTVNLSSPDFESIRNALSSYDMHIEHVEVDASNACQESES